MTFDKAAYMLEYMKAYRTGRPASRSARMKAALTDIITLTDGKSGEVATKIRSLAEEALNSKPS